MRTVLATIAFAAAAIAAPAFAQAVDKTDYVKQAGASDAFEIAEAKAMLTTTNPQVRSFARRMITDHTKSTAMVKAAALKDGVRVTRPMLNAEQASELDQLKAAKGTAKDALYIQQQKPAHEQALQLHQSFATSAPDDASNLRRAAGQIVPVVQQHIDLLNQMPAM